MTRYEAFWRGKFYLKHLRIFECTGFRKRGHNRVTKLTKQAELCTFLGYAGEHQAYQVLWTTEKVIAITHTLTLNDDDMLQELHLCPSHNQISLTTHNTNTDKMLTLNARMHAVPPPHYFDALKYPAHQDWIRAYNNELLFFGLSW